MKIYPQLKSAEGIAALLSSEDFTQVYRLADQIRCETVGDIVHLRAIIEFSNICKRQCVYCGLNRENKELGRFRMSREEILEAAAEAVSAGYRTIVLQSGEDDYFTAGRLADIIKSIKEMEVPSEERTVSPIHPAVTISCGERCEEDYRIWKQAGADRYLLKHETADPRIYDELHPCGTLQQRVKCLKILSRLGYETGSGFMVGLPGQTLRTLGEDLLLLKEIPCKMAGIGPFISNPKTPLADQPDGDPEMARRAVAVARILLPEANLPLTTSLSVLSDKEKRRISDNPFSFGANVVMKKVTPDKYKKAYEIYPAEFKKTEILQDRKELERLIKSYGRKPL